MDWTAPVAELLAMGKDGCWLSCAGHRPPGRLALRPGQRDPAPPAVPAAGGLVAGLHFLVEQADGAEGVKIRVLTAGWKELVRDLERAIEFDQSQLFRKVYSDEFGTPGGEPFGLLLGDYEIWPRPSAAHPLDDIGSPADDRRRWPPRPSRRLWPASTRRCSAWTISANWSSRSSSAKAFDQMEYFHWNALRKEEDVRFLGLTMPRVLMRLPYEDDGSRADGFRFREDVTGPDRSRYLWGTAVYAFGAVVLQAFVRSGWLADIRGVKPGAAGGGRRFRAARPQLHDRQARRGPQVFDRRDDQRLPGTGTGRTGIHAVVPLPGDGTCRFLHEPVDPEGEEVRRRRRRR